MVDSTKYKSELTVINNGAGGITDFTSGCKMQSEKIDRLLRRISSLPEVRRDYIITVWEQLAEGKYDCDEKIDRILGKLFAMVARKGHPMNSVSA